MIGRKLLWILAIMGVPLSAPAAACPVSYGDLTQALKSSVKPSGGPTNGGLDNNEWAAVVDRKGKVCAVTRTGAEPTDQWLASRAIAIEKANTANGMSLAGFALSTANLYAGGQPGGPLFGMALSNPPDPEVIYAGPSDEWGTAEDPALNKVPGGVIVFGGGLPLYKDGKLVGALGASGDTSCADHNIAWRVREKLGMGKVPAGVSPKNNDGIIYDVGPKNKSASGWGHPTCGGSEAKIAQQIGAGFQFVTANPHSK